MKKDVVVGHHIKEGEKCPICNGKKVAGKKICEACLGSGLRSHIFKCSGSVVGGVPRPRDGWTALEV
ncbi:MAG: hypothetical protein KKA90_03470 [Nanoarchaeota archaeon]|nr:hypothetical protein [Nanoarchaeota archaeon]